MNRPPLTSPPDAAAPLTAEPDAAAPLTAEPDAAARTQVDELRLALNRMFGAERRLRGRDHNRPGELTYAQIRALAALGREHEMTAGQLAKSADLNPAPVTPMLDHLEAADIVQRHRSTEDRRVCNVSLTPEGWELLERKLAGWRSLWQERMAGFADDEIRAAARIIDQVTGIYETVATLPPAPPPESE